MDTVNTTPTSGTSNYFYAQNCPQRLPCGLCRLTNSFCPMGGITITNEPFTWGINPVNTGGYKTTCNTNTDSQTEAWNGQT